MDTTVAPFDFLGTWDSPVVATAIHTGHELRPEVAELMVLDEQERFREEDPFTHLIAQLVPARVKVNRSRFEVDLNRSPEKAVYRTPEDCWGLDVAWRGAARGRRPAFPRGARDLLCGAGGAAGRAGRARALRPVRRALLQPPT